MKRIIINKRICFYNPIEDKVIAVMGELYNPDLSDYDVLCTFYNPKKMVWIGNELWLRNNAIRVEVIHEGEDKRNWFERKWRFLFR